MTTIEKYGFDVSVTPPLFCMHQFELRSDCLEHTIDGALRAVVPREHAAEYVAAPGIAQALSEADTRAINEWASAV